MPIERHLADRWASIYSIDDAIETLMRARANITNWEESSILYPRISRGRAYNMFVSLLSTKNEFTKNLTLKQQSDIFFEFGEYSPIYNVWEIKENSDFWHEEPNNIDLSEFMHNPPRMLKIK